MFSFRTFCFCFKGVKNTGVGIAKNNSLQCDHFVHFVQCVYLIINVSMKLGAFKETASRV